MNFSWFKKQKFQSLNQDVPATSLVNEIQSNMYWCIFMVQKFNWTISSHQNADFKDIHLCTVFSAEFIWSLPTVPHIENFRQFEINCGFFQNRNQNQIEKFFLDDFRCLIYWTDQVWGIMFKVKFIKWTMTC